PAACRPLSTSWPAPRRRAKSDIAMRQVSASFLLKAYGLALISTVTSTEFLQALLDLLNRILELLFRDGVGNAQVSGRAAQAAGDDGDIGVLQQIIDQVYIAADHSAILGSTADVMLDVPEEEI